MSLDAFKRIFWWEWAHRVLARGVGFVFALPLLFFWATGRIERGLGPKLVGLLALGGLQGAVGWWMVASGLVERTDVSQYRLAIHLTLACAHLRRHHGRGARACAAFRAAGRSPRRSASPASSCLPSCSRSFSADWSRALDAGLTYNTWPLMDGALVPGDLFVIEPGLAAISSRTPRPCSSCTGRAPTRCSLLALWHMIATRRRLPGTTHARRALVLFHLVLVQAAIGIATLLMQVPLHWALLHQGFALVVLGFAAAHWRGTKGAYPLPTEIRGRAG